MIRGKIWGSTELLFCHNNVECHRIKIKAGYACSWHLHHSRQNEFYVLDGQLIIQVQKNEYPLTDNTLLEVGQRTYAPAGEKHRFVALTDVDALEWYWVDLKKDDIKRDDHGKKLSEEEISKIVNQIRD